MKALPRLIVFSLIACLGWVGCGPSGPRTSLHKAVEQGNLKVVQQHIAAKSDLNKKDAAGWTPLHLAAMKGDVAIVQALIQAGADVKRPGGLAGKTPLQVAQEKGKTEVVRLLQDVKQAQPKSGRGLIDGGLGVGAAMDSGL
jgi:ankyrin repeat protein